MNLQDSQLLNYPFSQVVLMTVGIPLVSPRYQLFSFYHCLLAREAREGSCGQRRLPLGVKPTHSINIFLTTLKKYLEDTQI